MIKLKNKFSIILIISSLILSLIVVFIFPLIFDSFKAIYFRLLIAFLIFFGTLTTILLIKLYGKKETKEFIEAKTLENLYKNEIKQKVKLLKQKFNDALKIVKRASVYKIKSRYELPWYLVLGEEGEGKSSLVKYSGLNFPINYEDKNIDDNEGFKWYFSEKSIFIDLPGHYIQQTKNPEDPILWKYFLKLFSKKRWRRPINGIILTISIDTFLNRSNKDLENFAKQLRDRFDELSQIFKSSIPIYLVITKSDKIDGFNEYFNTLSKEEKSEIFGITFKNKDLENNNISNEFIELIQRLNSSIIDKIHTEWIEENREKIFLFTEKLSQLASKIIYFTDICFSKTRYRKPLMLRGIYFTSIERNYSLSEKPKALFMKKLLKDLIFEEADIGIIDKKYQKLVKKTQVITYTASVLIILLCSFFMINSFVNLNDKLSEYKEEIIKLVDLQNKIDTKSNLEELSKVLKQFRIVNNLEEDLRTNNLFNKIFFKFDDKSNYIKDVYNKDLLSLLLNKSVNQIENNLRKDLNDFSKTWDNTKAYLMLSIEEKRENKFLQNYMESNWKKIINSEEVQKNLAIDWANLLELDFKYNIKQHLVDKSRANLIKVSTEQLIYEEWKNKFKYLDKKSFSFSEILGENTYLFRGTKYKIPGLYTKAGYDIVLIDGAKVLDDILDNNWIIGNKINLTKKERKDYYDKIIRYYFADYKRYWDEALASLTVVTFTDLFELNNQLAIFLSPDSPIITILKNLKINTNLFSKIEILQNSISEDNNTTDESTFNLVEDATIDPQSVKSLREYYKNYNELLDDDYKRKGPLNSLFSEFTKIYEIMNNMNSSINLEKDSFDIISNRVQGKISPMLVELNLMPIQIKKWYGTIIQANLDFIVKYAKTYILNQYNRDVISFYNDRLRDKYPINNSSNINVDLDDFNEFFRKDGIFDNFYKKYISNFIEINYKNSVVESRNIDGNRLSFSQEFIESLVHAEEIRKSIFKNDGTLGFSINIKPSFLSTNLATSEFSYDSNILLYEHGPIISKRISWPNIKNISNLKFKLFDLSNKIVIEEYIGNDEWAIFKFLDKNHLSKGENLTLDINYSKYGYESSYIIDGSIVPLYLRSNGLKFSLPSGL